MTHPPGTVLVIGQEQARYHRFTISLNELKLPEGSQTVFGIGSSIVQNLNCSLRELRDQDEWVWIVGDDHVFESDTLLRLLDRDVEMIAPLCVQRMPPWPLVHYSERIHGTDVFRTVMIDELPEDGEPFEVEATGSLTLIRRPVLDRVGDPWFRTDATRQNEDMDFCTRVRATGTRILVDPAVSIGHIGHMISYPQVRNGVWGLVIDFPGTGRNQIFYPGGIDPDALGELRGKRELVAG